MAKKTSKATREQIYREIIEKEGLKWDDCKVLSFAFKQERRPELFHFGLMLHEPRPVYYLFDCWEKYAYVIAPKDEKNAAVIISIAEKDGGEKITPNLR